MKLQCLCGTSIQLPEHRITGRCPICHSLWMRGETGYWVISKIESENFLSPKSFTFVRNYGDDLNTI